MPPNIKPALAELLRLADNEPDNVAKNLICCYDESKDHAANVESMSSSKVKVSDQETCAKFLRIKLVDEDNKKIYSNNAKLADRIIIKIESLFPKNAKNVIQNIA